MHAPLSSMIAGAFVINGGALGYYTSFILTAIPEGVGVYLGTFERPFAHFSFRPLGGDFYMKRNEVSTVINWTVDGLFRIFLTDHSGDYLPFQMYLGYTQQMREDQQWGLRAGMTFNLGTGYNPSRHLWWLPEY